MQPESSWLYPSTSAETVLKIRPLAADLFARLGLNPWKALHGGVGELCAEGGIPWSRFFQEVIGLQVPPAESDWKALTLPHLLDFLVSQHREFLHGHLPAIGHVLSSIPDSDAETMGRLRNLAAEWPAFSRSLTAHLQEEEDSLFFRVLRYDACSRHGTADPEFEGGSVRVFTVVRMLEHEHRDIGLFRRFLDKALPGFPRRDGEVLEERLRPLLSELEAALIRHAWLETEVLFPAGVALEKTIYDLRIRGKVASRDAASTFNASTRG